MEVVLDFDVGRLPVAADVVRDFGLQPGGRIQKRHAQNVLKHMGRFMPMVSSGLVKLTRVSPDGTEITTNAKQAGFLHGARLMVDPLTKSAWARAGVAKVVTTTPLTYNTEKQPLAGGHWDLRMMAAGEDRITAELQAMIDGERMP